MPVIYLPRDVVVHVSDEDYPDLTLHSWYEHKSKHTGNSYAYRLEPYICPILNIRRRRKIYMHRQITKAGCGYVVDHRDGCTLNNRRSNLRITTGTFNNANRDLSEIVCCTGYRGVSKTPYGKYRARIKFHEVKYHLGNFMTAEEAARAYDEEALRLFGEFAWVNFDTRQDCVSESIPF